MTTLHAGIDEAGYGPLLGPLAIAQVSAEADDGIDSAQAFSAAGALVGDSKRIHTSGDIAAIESVALAGLAWLTGRMPETAAACFALFDEHDDARHEPWMQGADDVRLPIAAPAIARWRIAGLHPRSISGALIHPDALNQAAAAGTNRAEVELRRIAPLLRGLPVHARTQVICDRLGGRRYYRDFLTTAWPEAMVLIEDEVSACSAYRAVHTAGETRVAFHVGGEQASPLVALASCIAKYARELHMLLLNRWWCATMPGLRPTAGYGSDAYRWLGELEGTHLALAGTRARLVRTVAEKAEKLLA